MAKRPAVKVLLDTCALLALARGDLPPAATAALRNAPHALVSSVSAWEVAVKAASGKLRLAMPAEEWFLGLIDRYRLTELPLDARTACAAAALPPLHQDPFDRVLVALAHAHALAVITSDASIPRYPGMNTIW